MADARLHGARVLAAVALQGQSLRAALAAELGAVPAARDRAFVTALAHEGARWWLRHDAALGLLLRRPLPRRDAVVRALLVLALVQLDVLGTPDYAVVDATVAAVRAAGRPRLAGLANAVLRRWLRERDALRARLDAAPQTRLATPAWLLERIRADWPEEAAAIHAAMNAPAPPVLRVNPRVTTRPAFLDALTEAGIEAAPDAHLAQAVRLAAHTDITRLPGFAAGAFSVQDAAAQWAAALLAPAPGQRVLDACAAPGGKSAHLLEQGDIELLALDRDARRLERVRENLTRLQLTAQVACGDAGAPDAWWDGRAFDRILLDAPCSATGVIRRHPDIKLHRRASDIPALAAEQARLLAALWPLLAPGGRLLYATCSVLRAENEAVIAGFRRGRDDVRELPWQAPIGRKAGAGRQLLPGVDGCDGMYYALLEKAPG